MQNSSTADKPLYRIGAGKEQTILKVHALDSISSVMVILQRRQSQSWG